MDIKIEVKEEPSSPDFRSQNGNDIFSKDLGRKFQSETIKSGGDLDIDTKRDIEEEARVSNFCSQNERESSSAPITRVNKSSKASNIEIKEEQWQLGETSTGCDDIRGGKDVSFSSAESGLCKDGVSSYISTLLSNEDLGKGMGLCVRKNSHESESGSKFKSQEINVSDITSMKVNVCSLLPDDGKIYSLNSGLILKDLLQQSNTNKQHINKENCTNTSILGRDNLSRICIKVYTCGICKKCFIHLSDLKSHKIIHNIQKAYVCDICGEGFAQLSQLKTHKLIHEYNKPHQCDICTRSFKTLSSLKRHKLIHKTRKLYKCSVCQMAFKYLSYLKIDTLVNEGKRPHKCSICKKGFTSLSYLKTHKLIHEGKMQYTCNVCDKAFTRLSHLKKHGLLHEGPHKCNICNKTFIHLSEFKGHSLIHKGEKPHKCKTCDKTFTHLPSLKIHELTHEGKKQHMCNSCEKAFTLLSL